VNHVKEVPTWNRFSFVPDAMATTADVAARYFVVPGVNKSASESLIAVIG
jgi:hypothetical protein